MIQAIYDRVLRPHLPRKLAMCNGVVAPRVKLLDATDHFPLYEDRLLSCVREFVQEGDRVVDVGGGFGVAAVAAARQGATVTTFEAAAEQLPLIERTAELNGVADQIDVRHAIVGPEEEVWGSTEGAEFIDPRDLPEADVLVVDIEGAEVGFMDRYRPGVREPRVGIVEIHKDRFDERENYFRRPWETAGYSVDCFAEPDTDELVSILCALRQDVDRHPAEAVDSEWDIPPYKPGGEPA